MYNVIQNKRNLILELHILRKALLPYKNIILHKINQNILNGHEEIASETSSKSIYDCLIKRKNNNVPLVTSQLGLFGINDDSVKNVFKVKLLDIKEIKLKEFNYKLLNDILPCNANLKKWRIINSDKCDVCEESQTAKHLLFDCIYVKPIWKVIESILHCNISYSDIFCGFHNDNSLFSNYLCSMCAFVIYKEWLLCSLKSKKRPSICNLSFFENEICFRFDIYDRAGLNYLS